MNVLLVEDEPRVASFVIKGLRANGHDVEWCCAGHPAIAEIDDRGDQWDIVLLDLGLPDVDGLDVLQHMRDCQLATPVIIVTARSDDESKIRASQLGVRDYLIKPFSFADVLSRLEDHGRASRTTANETATDPSGRVPGTG